MKKNKTHAAAQTVCASEHTGDGSQSTGTAGADTRTASEYTGDASQNTCDASEYAGVTDADTCAASEYTGDASQNTGGASEYTGAAGAKVLLDVPYISQKDRYPTGCESVSAVMLLNYLGYGITVDSFIADYLEIEDFEMIDGIRYGPHPEKVFCGDPYSEDGMGCYAPVIVNTLNKIFNDTSLIKAVTEIKTEVAIQTQYLDAIKTDTVTQIRREAQAQPEAQIQTFAETETDTVIRIQREAQAQPETRIIESCPSELRKLANETERSGRKICTAVNETGTPTEILLSRYIDKGMPVIFWACIEMREPIHGPEWRLKSADVKICETESAGNQNSESGDGKDNGTEEIFTWTSNEHCMLLVGYDKENYYFNDPHNSNGLMRWPRELVEARHRAQHSMAVSVDIK